MAALFQRDLANVEAGIYPLPVDNDGSLPVLLERSRLFFDDLPEIHRRRENRGIGRCWAKLHPAGGPATTCKTSISSRAAG